MDDLKTCKMILPLSKIITILCSSGIPAIVNIVGVKLFYKQSEDNFDYILLWSAFIGVILTIAVTTILHNILPRFKFFRSFKDYEGQWLQIIPDSKARPYSIIDFTYNKELHKYELYGVNFYEDLSKCINFEAYRFVERTFRDGFYYITNQTSENKNGLGKIGFIKSNYDNLTRAEGYFFDSSSDDFSVKYNTILIKCDDAFFEFLDSKFRYAKISNIPPIEIMKLSKEFARKEIDSYNNIHKKQPEMCPTNNPCKFCQCDRRFKVEEEKAAVQ